MGDKVTVVATFKNARTTILAESCCVENKLQVKVIATPTDISSECGMSLEFSKETMEKFKKFMDLNNIKYNLYERDRI